MVGQERILPNAREAENTERGCWEPNSLDSIHWIAFKRAYWEIGLVLDNAKLALLT